MRESANFVGVFCLAKASSIFVGPNPTADIIFGRAVFREPRGKDLLLKYTEPVPENCGVRDERRGLDMCLVMPRFGGEVWRPPQVLYRRWSRMCLVFLFLGVFVLDTELLSACRTFF